MSLFEKKAIKASFLQARDPSILAFNRAPNLAPIKTNLSSEFGEITQQQKPDEPENIRIYLRIKDCCAFDELYEVENDTVTLKVPSSSICSRVVKDNEFVKRSYSFTKVFKPETTQKDLFDNVVKPKILDFINGSNSTLMTYGASGSGKTYTLIGTDQEPGLVPRSLEYLFRTLSTLSQNSRVKPSPSGSVELLTEVESKKEKLLCRSLLSSFGASSDRSHLRTYMTMQQRLSSEPVAELDDSSDLSHSVWVSFAEIYNEQIFDLLAANIPRGHQRPRLRLGMSHNNTYIKNLTHVNVSSGEEAYQILQYGLQNLNYASTQLNKHSSRSHSIFTIKLVQVSNTDGGYCVSSFNFCDLAGSERTKKTQNIGDRLKESNNINSSLLVLGRCISAIRNSQKQNDHSKVVPFRESKLTQLFQKALSGNEDIAMIVTISSSKEMFDETQHVLNFSAIAKEISVEQKKTEVRRKNRFSELVESNNDCDEDIEEYKNVILLLQEEIENQKHEFELNQQLNYNFLKQGYDDLIQSIENQKEEALERAEKMITARYEYKLKLMKLEYEKRIDQLEKENDKLRGNESVIEIDSSDEENYDPNENKLIKDLNSTKQTLMEGVVAHKELMKKYEEIKRENLDLKAKYLQLELENEELRKQLAGRSFLQTEYEDDFDDENIERTTF